LTSHVNAVRKAVGDNGEEQRLIRTGRPQGISLSSATSGKRRMIALPGALAHCES
jgi:DNA-binding winged helix-turn-helix (wHTH) protein